MARMASVEMTGEGAVWALEGPAGGYFTTCKPAQAPGVEECVVLMD